MIEIVKSIIDGIKDPVLLILFLIIVGLLYLLYKKDFMMHKSLEYLHEISLSVNGLSTLLRIILKGSDDV